MKKYNIYHCKIIARKKGGDCLSISYKNMKNKLIWMCKNGHKWEAAFRHIKEGGWCPECSFNKKRASIEDIKLFAEKKGGKCLATFYKNNKEKILWECKEGHKWYASWDNIKHNKWCPTCAGNRRKTINQMQDLAHERGGKCLARKYTNSHTKLLWECKFGHKWKASPTHIQQGQWCNQCSSFFAEKVCRRYFEELFKSEFKSAWPLWLVNSFGNRMQLDGFNSELKIAFEHNGSIHYTKPSFLSEQQFAKRQLYDKEKIEICQKNNIRLFIIKELFSKTSLKNLKSIIIDQCNDFGLSPDFSLIQNVNISDIYQEDNRRIKDEK